MKPVAKWTEEFFTQRIGRKPENDDLDRINCDHAGEFMHTCCGVCKHDLPMFMCNKCLADMAWDNWKRPDE